MTNVSGSTGRDASSDEAPVTGGARTLAARSGRTWAASIVGAGIGAGAVLALWASGLVSHDDKPDVSGYRPTSDLCADARLSALTHALGESRTPHSVHHEHAALDRAACLVTLERQGQEQSYNVAIDYKLHKQTDPGPEFEPWAANPSYFDTEKEFVTERIPGVGDSAYWIRAEDASTQEILVRDGGAVLTLSVSTSITQSGLPETSANYVPQLDAAATRAQLIADMKDLMASLRN
ncbi:hypothetical protein [Streptomyces sp. NPDC090026]|uniref:hypothetical protein n=1 Tax=Streptomyces sp. NPDC090026 TaxID=3365923 RepID=UPI003829179A